MGTLNPIIGGGVTAITGNDPFTGRATSQRGWAALNQLLSMPSPARLAGLKAENIPRGDRAISRAPCPRRSRLLTPIVRCGSLLCLGFPIGGSNLRKQEALSRNVTKKYSDPVSSPFANPEVQ